jgi:MoaA/NifB/PqqE/SkfB family radical SAM enzyme
VFTGGEPTIHKALPACIRAARDLGFSAVGIRTNGLMFVYPDFVNRLETSGLSFIQISNISHAQTAFDAAAGVPRAHALVVQGIENALGAGFDVSVAMRVTRSSFSHIEKDIEFVLSAFDGIRSIVLRMAGFQDATLEPAPVQGMEERLPGLMAACHARGVALCFEPFAGVAPCLFRNPADLLHLFRYPAAAYFPKPPLAKKPGCADCPLDTLCNGVAGEYSHEAWPAHEGGVPQRVAAAIARAGVLRKAAPGSGSAWTDHAAEGHALTISERQTSSGESEINECILRTNYRCNEDCLFCFVDTHCAGPSDDVIERSIETIKQSGKKISIISISGGEPTLNPRLEEFLDMLRDVNAAEVCLQTNAVLLSDPAMAARMAAVGVDSAFVSLHSHDAVVSDLITGRHGAFHKTIQGIENLLAHGIFVYLSHVINSFNYATLPDFVDFVGANLKAAPIVFSFAAPHTDEIMLGGAIPRLSRVRGPLKSALDMCLDMKIPFSGLPGMCGLPLCIPGPNLRYFPDIHLVDQDSLQGVMHKNAGCSGCSLNRWCYGVRVLYVNKYGDAELEPVRISGLEPRPRDMHSRMDFFKSFFTQ